MKPTLRLKTSIEDLDIVNSQEMEYLASVILSNMIHSTIDISDIDVMTSLEHDRMDVYFREDEIKSTIQMIKDILYKHENIKSLFDYRIYDKPKRFESRMVLLKLILV